MGKQRRRRDHIAFSASQIQHMEKLLADNKSGLFDATFCQHLAKHFNRSSGQVGGNIIQVHQVQEWFRNKLTSQESEVTNLPFGQGENEVPSDTSLSNNVPEMSSDMARDAGEKDKMPDLDKLEFEAQSSRDFAWYDVSTFLAHRISNNEVEVRVRYADFGADEDEWVNVKKAIRVRSIPLESSECIKVHAGDLVLCFREGSNEAVHYDAHVIEIERKLHDVRGCRCLFLVKYDHDETEEKVHLSRLCRRPKF